MDYKAIDKILDKYFEGNANLEEEKLLKKYFASAQIAPEHLVYKPMFSYFAHTQAQTNPRPIQLKTKKVRKNYFLAIAASLIIGLGLFSMIYQHQKPTTTLIAKQENKNIKEDEAIKTLQKFSKNAGEGIRQAGALSMFGQTTQRVFNIKQKENQKKSK